MDDIKYNPNKDYGTPKSTAEKSVTLNIDGVNVSVPEGTSIIVMEFKPLKGLFFP